MTKFPSDAPIRKVIGTLEQLGFRMIRDVRESLRRGDLAAASRLASVFTLAPVAASLLPENRVAGGFSPPAPHHLASA